MCSHLWINTVMASTRIRFFSLPGGSADHSDTARRHHNKKRRLTSRPRNEEPADTKMTRPREAKELMRTNQTSNSEMKIHSVTHHGRSNSLPVQSTQIEKVEVEIQAIHECDLLEDSAAAAAAALDHSGSPCPAPPSAEETPAASSELNGDLNSISVQESDTVLFSGGELSIPNFDRRGTSAFVNYAGPVAHRGVLFGKRQTNRRLVQKGGHSNVNITKASTRKRRYLRDFFTTIMDLKWRYHVVLFVTTFLISWLLFGVAWLALAIYNGDTSRVIDDNTTDYCLRNVYDFSTAFLFSIETQTTIGFGFRIIGPECPVGSILMMFQTVVGVFTQCFLTGIMFAKIARPKRRAETIVFSHAAVVCIRDGFYHFIFRVGDLRKAHIIGTSIRALLVKSRKTSEGELIPLCQYPLDLITESSMTDSYMFFFWPVTVAHRITESSPLWNLSAESLLTTHFEVIVILEGTVQTSGSLIQIKTSYIPSEIRWGQRLTPLVTTLCEDGDYEIDYSNFHDTTPVSMPDYSAKEYAEKLASNTVCPVEHEYQASLTNTVLNMESERSIRLALKPSRLQALFKQTKAGQRPWWYRGKSVAKTNSSETVDDHQETATDSPQAETDYPSTAPPNYASLSSHKGFNHENPNSSRMKIIVTDYSDENANSAPRNPRSVAFWLDSGAQDNAAFDASQA